ncbi:protein of unknown function [Maribacter ulvicola]|uniref:AsmA-like C-terminal region n=2 Tax=Maribacter ulvicola TaxID=228959 RepID=A0A1N6PAC1_9FLAO|nr:protein of unknown function [Maribacter ulvicola]
MIAEWKVKKEIIAFLEQKVPNHIEFTYDELTLSLLKGSIAFNDVEVVNLGKQTSSCEIKINANQFAIKGFNYWKMLFEKSIFIKSLTLSKPHLKFRTCPKRPDNKDEIKNNPIKLIKEIFIEDLILDSGIVEVWDSEEKVELISVESIKLHLNNVATNPDIITKYLPFTSSKYNIEFKNFNAPLGKYEKLQMASMVMKDSTINITDLSLFTVYSKTELSKEITYERDHVNLSVPVIEIENHNYSVANDSIHIYFKELLFTQPNLEIYRDKSNLEDLENKLLYGKLLQKLPFKLAIDSVLIKKGTIVYEEDIPNNTKAGALNFDKLNANIGHLSNIKNEKPLNIQLNANLMGTGKLHLNWQFDVHDPKSAFQISGELSKFNTVSLNDFLVPNLRTQTTGTIDQFYFTISGNEDVAVGDIKMSYDDFKFEVLNKDRNGVKKVLSFIGNLLVSDGSKADEYGYRYGDISAERVKNKSFFNYLWISIKDGLLSVLTGNGKKE